MLDEIVDRKEPLKRLVELKSKVMVTAEEYEKFSTWSGPFNDTSTIWRDKRRGLAQFKQKATWGPKLQGDSSCLRLSAPQSRSSFWDLPLRSSCSALRQWAPLTLLRCLCTVTTRTAPTTAATLVRCTDINRSSQYRRRSTIRVHKSVCHQRPVTLWTSFPAHGRRTAGRIGDQITASAFSNGERINDRRRLIMSNILSTAAAIIALNCAALGATMDFAHAGVCADQITQLRRAAQIGRQPTSGYAQLMFSADLTRAEAMDAEGKEEACLPAARSAAQYLVLPEANTQ
jgi:hypothetical protein